MTQRVPTQTLGLVAALLGIGAGVAALWTGLAGMSDELARTLGGRGLGWAAGMALAAQVLVLAALLTVRLGRRHLLDAR